MSAGWEVGDKALCLAFGPWTGKGAVYTVTAVVAPGELFEGARNNRAEAMLRFAELDYAGLDRASEVSRFRKVKS